MDPCCVTEAQAIAVVREIHKRVASDDLDAMLALFHDDAVMQLYISQDTLPFGGETRGRDAIRQSFLSILRDWERVLYRPLPYTMRSDGTVNCQVEYMFRHRASGEVLCGRMRHVWVVRDGRAARYDEYLDAAVIEAFVRLVGSQAPEGVAGEVATKPEPDRSVS